MSNVDVANYLLLPLSYYQYYGYEMHADILPFQYFRTSADVGTLSPTGLSSPSVLFSRQKTAHMPIQQTMAAQLRLLHTNRASLWQKTLPQLGLPFLVGIAEIDYDSIPYKDDPVQDYSWMWQYCSEYGIPFSSTIWDYRLYLAKTH